MSKMDNFISSFNKDPWQPTQFANNNQQSSSPNHPISNDHNNNVGAIYITDIQQQQQQQQTELDENGQPIKIKKKPGRKPNPASPALRKAQNRAAQRAFRERKEHHLKDLETTIRQLREQRNNALKELGQAKNKLDSFRTENWYLKGVVLTLQFVCLHHNIHIPTHSPYLTEDDLSEMAKTTPHAIEAYVNAYTKNNINLKPTVSSHFRHTEDIQHDLQKQTKASQKDVEMLDEEEEEEDEEEKEENNNHHNQETDNSETVNVKHEPNEQDPKSNTSAIQQLRLQLQLQSAISNVSKESESRLQPTILQLAIPHDPRIDLIPTPHMRDRMIIFRDQMDYDRCFNMLIEGTTYRGGDPTMSASWELPAEFFTEYWYLAINYEIAKTNAWRRLKGLPELSSNHNTTQSPLHPSSVEFNSPQKQDWAATDDVFAQFTAGMPTLQPLDLNHLTSGFDFGSPPASMFDGQLLHRPNVNYDPLSFNLFQQLMSSPSESHTEVSPNIDVMMDLMNSLSTNMQK